MWITAALVWSLLAGLVLLQRARSPVLSTLAPKTTRA